MIAWRKLHQLILLLMSNRWQDTGRPAPAPGGREGSDLERRAVLRAGKPLPSLADTRNIDSNAWREFRSLLRESIHFHPPSSSLSI